MNSACVYHTTPVLPLQQAAEKTCTGTLASASVPMKHTYAPRPPKTVEPMRTGTLPSACVYNTTPVLPLQQAAEKTCTGTMPRASVSIRQAHAPRRPQLTVELTCTGTLASACVSILTSAKSPLVAVDPTCSGAKHNVLAGTWLHALSLQMTVEPMRPGTMNSACVYHTTPV